MGTTEGHRACCWLACCIALTLACQAEDICDGPVVQLGVQPANESLPRTVYGVLAGFGGIPSLNMSAALTLAVADPLSACEAISPAPGAVVLVQRGNCSFVNKYEFVVAAGGKAMLVFNNEPGCATMGGSLNTTTNGSGPADPSQQPPAISLDQGTGQALLALLKAGAVSVTLQLLEMSPLDGSAALLWLMAVGTVIGGSLWCGADALAEAEAEWERRQHGPGGGGGEGGGSAKNPEVLEITAAGAVGFVLMASAMLLLLFFFLNQAFFYVILVLFCLAGAQALGVLLMPLLAAAAPSLCYREVEVRWLGPLPLLALLVTPVSLAVAAVWGVYRHSSWSWVLQDLLGIAIMLLVLRTLRLGSLKVACVLLPLCFFYDVFWVFLQPLLFGGGSSVMVQVAEGAGSNEFLPMLLRVPRLSGPPIVHGYSLLGFGDIILPGLLVSLSRCFDLKSGAAWYRGYFVPAVVGYGSGLLLTYTALMFSWFGDEGQPALLYLVPCTLGTVLGLAAWRGELRGLWVEKEGQGWDLLGGGSGEERGWGGGRGGYGLAHHWEEEEQEGGEQEEQQAGFSGREGVGVGAGASGAGSREAAVGAAAAGGGGGGGGGGGREDRGGCWGGGRRRSGGEERARLIPRGTQGDGVV